LVANYKKKEQEMLEFQRTHQIQVKGEPPVTNNGENPQDKSEGSGGVLV
jgi:hypothetical protein